MQKGGLRASGKLCFALMIYLVSGHKGNRASFKSTDTVNLSELWETSKKL